jgi:16S rRNA (cytosine967-C5)-methyltransferase
MEGRGEVVAVERHAGRARALRASCERMRAANVTVVTADAKDFDGEAGFDRVLLDPPCSGLGTLRSHPDLRWHASPAGIERLVVEQDALLASARRALRPGGTLVYSVCTLSPSEERLVTEAVQRTFPHVDGTDGFYIARDGG